MSRKWLISVFTVIMMVVVAGTAQADKIFSPSCNSNPGHWVTAQAPTFANTGFNHGDASIHFTQYCGSGTNIVEAELQSSTDSTHWTDVVGSNGKSDFIYNTPTNEGNVVWSRTSGAPGQVYCDGSLLFRDHVWYYNGGEDTSGIVQPSC